VEGDARCSGEPVLDLCHVAQSSQGDVAGVVVPGGDEVFEGGAEDAGGCGDSFGEVLDPGFPVIGGLGGDDAKGFEGGFGWGQVVEAFVDERVGEGFRVLEGLGQ